MNEACHYCGARRRHKRSRVVMTRDHVVPRALGGPERLWNIVRACQPCNTAKADRLPPVEHVAECSTCTEALARWAAGERQATRKAEREWFASGRVGPLAPPIVVDPPVWDGTVPAVLLATHGATRASVVDADLVMLSPAMQDLLMRRRKKSKSEQERDAVVQGQFPPGWPDVCWEDGRKES